MLHGYKKSRYNIYDNLEFLGLNPYEQKHFCFGEEGSDDAGGDYDADIDRAVAEAQVDARAQDAMAQLADQLSLAQEEFMSARSAAEKAEGLQDLMDMGIYGYNEAVEKGFVDAIEQAQRDSDFNLAYDMAQKYGLEFDPMTGSYKGPGSLMATISEMMRGAGLLAANIVDMMPGPFGIVQGLAGLGRQDSFAGLVGQARGQSREEQAPSLAGRVGSYMDEVAASQREANMEARGLTDPDTAGIIDDFEEEAAQKGAFSTSDISGVTASSDISGVTAPSDISSVTAPTNTTTGFDDIDFDGNEFIPLAPAIPSVPSVAPQPAAEVVRPPVTRTAAADNFSILVDIYGPEVAAQLLPNRIV